MHAILLEKYYNGLVSIYYYCYDRLAESQQRLAD